jgi:glycerol uptake facilitator-like aquaporin
MSPLLGEVCGTMLLVILGDGVVANVLLNKSKGQNSGWIVITTGWALAVTIAVYAVNAISGAHLNPAVTISAAATPILVGLLVWAIGLSLGGPTGYAINPAHDLGPRLAPAVLLIAGKGDSDWSYAWVPVIGPLVGGLSGAYLYRALWGA